MSASVWNRLPSVVLSLGFVLLFSSHAFAGTPKRITVYASGAITGFVPCSQTEVCQEVTVKGTGTRLGPFIGVLSERVDITDGTYAGTGVFTTSDGSTISTEFAGQVTPPNQDGRVFFFESHQVVSGTGQYADASGNLQVVGTADSAGQLQIVGVGTLSK